MNKLRHIIAFAGLAVLSACGDTGHGEKLGVVTRVDPASGVFCKTMEVEVMRGGMNNGTGVVGAPFHVTVEDPAMFKVLVDAMDKQLEVKIKYRKEFASFCRSDSTENAFLTSVELVHPIGETRAAPVQVAGVVAVARGLGAKPDETRDQKIQRLLATQAELLTELARK